MNEAFFQLGDYPQDGLAAAEAALVTAWDALALRYGQNDPGDEGMRMKEDLVTIALALFDFE